MAIYLNVDLSAILSLDTELRPQIEKALRDAGQALALQTHAKILEEAQQKLHSTRDKYVNSLEFKQVGADTWIISLDKSAMFIEEGMEEHEMLQQLLKSPKAKTAKDGSRYLVVPFQHNKGPTQQTQAQQDLTSTIKAELNRRQIPYGKVETDSQGRPKTGLLHSFDILKQPPKTANAPGQGRGPIGSVRQGPTGIPFLQGIRIYQKTFKDQKTGKESVKKGIMTFRVASSKHQGSGRWVHPGIEAKKFFDAAADWALQEWEQKIAAQVVDRVVNGL